jgi:hypothetical protein
VVDARSPTIRHDVFLVVQVVEEGDEVTRYLAIGGPPRPFGGVQAIVAVVPVSLAVALVGRPGTAAMGTAVEAADGALPPTELNADTVNA